PEDAGDRFMNLTITQRETIQAFERTGASLSLVGVFLIFATYAFFKRLRTLPNTFILFASIANVGASTACLIGYSGVLAGDGSPLCQVQGFLLEMFMQSDPWWSLAMAINVFAVFFWAASPNSFRKYLWAYALICFGSPAIPAVVIAIVRPDGVGIYGNATLWCWIADPYNSLRIFTYYLPIWTCILLSAVIYVAVGYQVFHQRNQLRNLTFSNPAKDVSGSDIRDSGEKAHGADSVVQAHCVHAPVRTYGIVTTEVQVHTTPPPTPGQSHLITPVTPPGRALHSTPWGSVANGTALTSPLSAATTVVPFTTISSVSGRATRRKHKPSFCGWIRRPWVRFIGKLRHLDPVKLAYLRTSFVFAISVLVTWTPSSINRVYTLVNPQGANYGLNLASAIVLPLQGVWNCVIFCATS
ncbi:hypothetical protein GQ53DRAFT_591127, partial [Thozetella sp. PMI_491]